jgi:hypothetical protein
MLVEESLSDADVSFHPDPRRQKLLVGKTAVLLAKKMVGHCYCTCVTSDKVTVICSSSL